MPHKSIHDNSSDPDPSQPVLTPPDFPKDLSNAADNIKADYDPVTGKIPLRLKYMGRFLGNDTKEISENDPWVLSEDIDPDLRGNFNNASSNMSKFQQSSDQLVDDFKNNIPNKFSNATDKLQAGGNDIKAFFN